jgi:hypothetical protein
MNSFIYGNLRKSNITFNESIFQRIQRLQSTLEGTEFLDRYFERTTKSRVKMRIPSSLGPKIETLNRENRYFESPL